MYLTTCDKCKDEYIRSGVDIEPGFRVHKNDIKTKTTTVVPQDILMKSVYVPFPLLDMSKFMSLNKSTWEVHQNLKKCLGIDKDTSEVNYSQLLMR